MSQLIKDYFSNKKKFLQTANNIKNNKKIVNSDIENALYTGEYIDVESLLKYIQNIDIDDSYDETNYINITPFTVKEIEEHVSNRIPKEVLAKLNVRLVELTDEMIYAKERQNAYAEEEEYLKAYENYIPPPRPKDNLDESLEIKKIQLEQSKKQLDEELIKPIPNTKGYVPPTRKKEYNEQFNPMVSKLNFRISTLENEIKDLEIIIVKENDKWIERKKIGFRCEYIYEQLRQLSKMQEKAPAA